MIEKNGDTHIVLMLYDVIEFYVLYKDASWICKI